MPPLTATIPNAATTLTATVNRPLAAGRARLPEIVKGTARLRMPASIARTVDGYQGRKA
jgi:hypothetical protein